MDRWLSVAPSRELERLEERLLRGPEARSQVPVLRAWGDAIADLATNREPRDARVATARTDAFLLRVADASTTATATATDQLLVAAERCCVAEGGALNDLYRGAEWRHAKRALTEDGVPEGVVEEIFAPATQAGSTGLVDPRAVAEDVAGIDEVMLNRVCDYFAPVVGRYLDTARSLAAFGEDGPLDPTYEIVVPWSAVMVLRGQNGVDLLRN